jgi:glucose/arabinose dehydrogenase
MRPSFRFVVLGCCLLLACTGQSQGHPSAKLPRSPGHASPTPAATLAPAGPLQLNTQVLAGGLRVPWEIGFLSNERILVTERTGRVRLIDHGQLNPNPVLTLSVVAQPGIESGLLGLAVHPGFPNPAYVYLYYTYSGAGGATNRVSRFDAVSGGPAGLTLTNEYPLLDGIPGGQCCHFGGRLLFGPDGNLYVTTGDGQVPTRAESTSSLNGKILRVTDSGAVPSGNPFPGSPVFAYGLRNPEGLAWDAAGHLYVSNNGPTGEFGGLLHHDEVDLVQPGGFYGWPVMAGNLPTGQAAAPGVPARLAPMIESGNDTWAPSGMTFYAPRSTEQQTLLVASLKAGDLLRLTIDPANPGRLVAQETLLSGFGRLRDAVTGPDACLYVLTSNRDGRGQPQAQDDRILRACPSTSGAGL